MIFVRVSRQMHPETMTDSGKEHSSEPLSQTTGGSESLRVSPVINRGHCIYQDGLPTNAYPPALASTAPSMSYDGAKRSSPHCKSAAVEEDFRVR